MNARLYQPAGGGEGETEGKEGDVIMEDGRQRPGHRSDPRGDNWIADAAVYAIFNECHVTARSEVDFEPRELPNPPLRDTMLSNGRTLPGNIVASFSNVAPRASDIAGSRIAGIEMSIPRSTMRSSGGGYATPACNIMSACNVATANCYDPQATLACNSLNLPQLESCAASTTTSRNCQLGAVDVEDLAMYFDLSADNSKPSPSARTIHARRSRQAARMDQSRQERRERFGSNYDRDSLYPCSEPSDPQSLYPCDVRSMSDPPNPEGLYSEAISDLEFSNNPAFGDPRFCHSGFSDLQRSPDLEFEPGRSDEARCDSGSWFCNSCPELFNFCSEERWLQCPASDRCPLYDSHSYDALVLPPCMYENLQASGKNNWCHGYAEDEQLLEDYL